MTRARGFTRVIYSYIQIIMKWYVYEMIHEYYVVCDELIC